MIMRSLLLITSRISVAGLLILSLSSANVAPHKSQPLYDLLRDLVKADSLSWQLKMRYDPYNGGHSLRTIQSERSELTLKAPGEFRLSSPEPLKEGQWIVDMHEKTIQFVYTRIDGQVVAKPIKGPIYEVRHYSDHILVLAQQGRHGWVEFHYEKH